MPTSSRRRRWRPSRSWRPSIATARPDAGAPGPRAARAPPRASTSGSLPADATIPRTAISVPDARDGRFDGAEIPARPRTAMDSGHRPGRASRRAARPQPAQRRLRAAVGRRRLDVRRRGRPRPGLDDVARQPAQPDAGVVARAGVSRRGRRRGRRDERLGGEILRPGDRRRLARRSSRSRCRSSAPAGCTSTTGTCAGPTARASRRRSSTSRSTWPTTGRTWRRCRGRWCSTCRRFRRRRRRRCGTTSCRPSKRFLGCRDGAIKAYVLVEQLEACYQLMEIRAALGAPLRRVQHRALGLHQQRVGRRWPGTRRSRTRTSTRSR